MEHRAEREAFPQRYIGRTQKHSAVGYSHLCLQREGRIVCPVTKKKSNLATFNVKRLLNLAILEPQKICICVPDSDQTTSVL